WVVSNPMHEVWGLVAALPLLRINLEALAPPFGGEYGREYMRHLSRRRNRVGRWALILAAYALGVLLLFINALSFFRHGENLSSFNLARFGFSAFTALVYLSVG